MSILIESLKDISQGFKTQRSRRNPIDLAVENIELDPQIQNLEQEKFQLISQILGHPEFQSMIDEGKITYAMIRPNLTLGKVPGSDDTIYDQIKDRIVKYGFEIILELPVKFGSDQVNVFYSEVKPKLETIPNQPGEGLPGTNTIWESFSNVMQGGGTTILLLFKEDADKNPGNTAWEHWRKLLGPTLPKPGEVGNIRADFGTRVNNIGHGSDSTESVHKETLWLSTQLQRFIVH